MADLHFPEADPAEERLDEYAGKLFTSRSTFMGYPVNQKIQLIGFYKWFMGSGLNLTMVNNAGDPFDEEPSHFKLNSLAFEREVLERLGPLYGFDKGDLWGIITFSGTDGNNHGIYFGANYLKKKTGQAPVVYVSEDAHYSSRRLADLQNLELRIIHVPLPSLHAVSPKAVRSSPRASRRRFRTVDAGIPSSWAISAVLYPS